MKKSVFISIAICGLLQASELTKLFEALKQNPTTKIDNQVVKMANLQKQKITDQFFPKITLFGSYEHYNSYTNLRPVPPNEANRLIKNRSPLPFAKDIERIGAKVDMPIFVKELFTINKKAKYLLKGAKLKKRLNFYKNEAVILGSYANLQYIKSLKKFLKARKKSLLKTYKDVKIKVDSGRAPQIALDKILSSVDSIDIALQNAIDKEIKTKEIIETLTGMEIRNIEEIQQISPLKKEEIFALKPLKEILNAKKEDLKAKKEKFLPKLLLEGKWSENYAKEDVMFDESLHTGYGSLALKVVLPLGKDNFTDIKIALANLQKEKENFLKNKIKLEAQAKSLLKQLQINKEIQKAAFEKSKRQESLLRYAKTAFEVGRITEEEYLRYEDSLLRSKADLALAKARKWQILAKLAVIYGNDLERIVK